MLGARGLSGRRAMRRLATPTPISRLEADPAKKRSKNLSVRQKAPQFGLLGGAAGFCPRKAAALVVLRIGRGREGQDRSASRVSVANAEIGVVRRPGGWPGA
jgi:hypothetical protein